MVTVFGKLLYEIVIFCTNSFEFTVTLSKKYIIGDMKLVLIQLNECLPIISIYKTVYLFYWIYLNSVNWKWREIKKTRITTRYNFEKNIYKTPNRYTKGIQKGLGLAQK